MYSTPDYMTVAVLSEILREFAWPAPYSLDDWSPDGIAMVFPKCTLVFVEGFESKMDIEFVEDDTGVDWPLKLGHALDPIREELERKGEIPPDPRLIEFFSPHASLEKVESELRDLCTLVLTYMQPTLLGDFSWARKYKS